VTRFLSRAWRCELLRDKCLYFWSPPAMIFSLRSFPAQVAVLCEVGSVRGSSEYCGC
jgi:hypothetical protein